ncbi:hypothetical protein A2U01_0043422, partial [Trifolium medium]|nr:hypothetical protein [Trifolium medium]
MFLFALDNPPPSSIMLISGDVDFAPALHILGQRGYTIILVIPAGVGVSSALCNAVVSQSLSEYNSPHVSYLPTSLRSYSLPSGLNDVAGGPVPS